MKVCWFGFLGKNHSWSIVAQNISRKLIEMGHEVDLFSTNGIEHFPGDLLPNLKGWAHEGQNQQEQVGQLRDDYDLQLSYTAFKNFPIYFIRGNKNRFGIWNYETDILPKAFAKYAKTVDKILPSSQFSKDIFVKNGVPSDMQIVVPHGIHIDRFQNLGKYPLKTNKKIKILANIAQAHIRKNIPGLLEAYGKAFDKKDDVCLVLKISNKPPKHPFDVNFSDAFSNFKRKYKNHAEIEIVDTFITDIETLYNSCDVVYTMTHTECFWMPGLEGFAANKIVIAPRYGGQLDFMNDDNSILVEGKECRAPLNAQYWEPSPYAKMFAPSTDHGAECLKKVYADYDNLLAKFSVNMKNLLPRYTWTKVVEQIVNLCE